ncbi:unnamed protein product, partial [Didymodactylos carnosus]
SHLKPWVTKEDYSHYNQISNNFLQQSFATDISFEDPLQNCPIMYNAFILDRTNNKDEISAILMAQYQNDNNENTYYVCYLSTLKDYLRQGLASYLLNQIISEAIEKRIDYVTLHVNIENRPALNLYRKCGFRCVRYMTGYYANDKRYRNSDGYLMIINTKHVKDKYQVCKDYHAVFLPPEVEIKYEKKCIHSRFDYEEKDENLFDDVKDIMFD